MAGRLHRTGAALGAGLVAAGVLAGGAAGIDPPAGVTIPGGTQIPQGAGAGAGAAQGPSAAMLASQVCMQLQAQMGAQFTAQFKTQAGCLAKVTALATAQAAKCAGAADQQTCITNGLMAEAGKLAAGGAAGAGAGAGSGAGAGAGAGSGAGTGAAPGGSAQGITPAALADTTATQTCIAAKAKLGAKFPFATQAACKAKVKPTALRLATAALATCKVPATMQACVTKAMQASSAQLQAALGIKQG